MAKTTSSSSSTTTTTMNNYYSTSMDAITLSDDKTAKDSLHLPSIIASNSKPRPLNIMTNKRARAERDTKAVKTNDVDRLPPSNWLKSLRQDLEDIQQDQEDMRQDLEDIRQDLEGLWRRTEQLQRSLGLVPQCCQAPCRRCRKYDDCKGLILFPMEL
jgi:hypothetical protein